MGKKRRQYTREFKLDAVRLVVEQGRSVTDVAGSLGLARGVVQAWKQQFLADGQVAFPGHGRLRPADEEVVALRKENARLRQERDILKKAAAYFASDKI